LSKKYVTPQPARRSIPILVGAALGVALVAGLIIILAVQLSGQGGSNSGEIALEFATEKGIGAQEGVANSPLKITVRVPWSDGSHDTTISSILFELLDEEGNPAQYGPIQPGPQLMRPTFDIGVWDFEGSVPVKPGTYHARLQIQALFDETKSQTLEMREPRLTVVAETDPPLLSGYVLNRESNLWLLATDGSRQRRLTYYQGPDEYAQSPAWSPDGQWIAFAYSPKPPPDELSSTDIWVIKPDGTGAKQVAAHGPNEGLLYPRWSKDGNEIYFTVESFGDPSSSFGVSPLTAPLGRVDRVGMESGERTQVIPSAQMAAPGGPDNDLVYLEFVPTQDLDYSSSPPQRLVKSDADGATRSVLVEETKYQSMYAPAMSPDGKWVAFAAVNTPTGGARPDPLGWLLFQPGIAAAHDIPWDVYVVSSSGGEAVRLTTLDEDQPYLTWLDSSTIAMIGVKGLHKVTIDGEGKAAGEPQLLHAGAQHSGLSWHGP
jgi:hypothetical protein